MGVGRGTVQPWSCWFGENLILMRDYNCRKHLTASLRVKLSNESFKLISGRVISAVLDGNLELALDFYSLRQRLLIKGPIFLPIYD